MCLNVVIDNRGKKCEQLNKKPVLIGYKVFEVDRNKVRFIFKPYKGIYVVPADKWLTSSTEEIWWAPLSGRKRIIRYDSGFHVFANERDAIAYASQDEIVVGVYCDNVVAIGQDSGYKVLVCKNMWVDSKDIVYVGEYVDVNKLKWRNQR